MSIFFEIYQDTKSVFEAFPRHNGTLMGSQLWIKVCYKDLKEVLNE
jgi:hypothetical protein